jgi:DNA-binding transcriptional regulator of glucitol operon
MHTTALVLLGAVVAGWTVQLYFTYRQSMAFTADVRALRPKGTVSVGAGGRRYRGGRAFVAIAVDERGVVVDALCLSGFTTFARGKALPAVLGMKASKLRGDADVPDLSKAQREAARQAATLLREARQARQARPVGPATTPTNLGNTVPGALQRAGG